MGRRLPGPRAIDPRSGFDVPHEHMRRQHDGRWVAKQYFDKPNPQEFVKAVPEQIAIPNPFPEPPDRGIAVAILTEDGIPMIGGGGVVFLTEGEVPSL